MVKICEIAKSGDNVLVIFPVELSPLTLMFPIRSLANDFTKIEKANDVE